jgi:deoxyribodipyrimidine photo-lyase
MKRVIVWFRKDLRLLDNPFLRKAIDVDAKILPVFIWNISEKNSWAPGEASKWWLQHALQSLDRNIQLRSGKLVILQGNPANVLLKLAEENQCETVYFGREYDTFGISEQEQVQTAFEDAGRTWESFNTRLIAEPWENLQDNGKGFQVFTKFWQKCRRHFSIPLETYDVSKIRFLNQLNPVPHSDASDLFQSHHWHQKLASHWDVSEKAAFEQLRYTKENILKTYRYKRNRPSQAGTSKLSPYLTWGLISPKRIAHEILEVKNEENRDGASKYLTEVGWREFAYHLLYHQPQISDHSLKLKFGSFPNSMDPALLEKWKTGMTGFPLVDAGMRELWETGWMHNRTRMLVASFLVKNLLIPWQVGAKWFWDTLVDADLANNSAGWQWSASTGVDYKFRVFNPHLQGAKFDAKGEYARRWIPELSSFSGRQIYSAEETDLFQNTRYPKSCVDYAESRKRAFELLEKLTPQQT